MDTIKKTEIPLDANDYIVLVILTIFVETIFIHFRDLLKSLNESSFPSANFFCLPDQVLVFFTILGFFWGISLIKSKEVEKLGKHITFLTCITVALWLIVTNIVIISGFLVAIIIISFILIIWNTVKNSENKKYLIFLFLLPLLAYIVSGTTGNACFYLRTEFHIEKQLDYNIMYEISDVPSNNVKDFPAIPCSASFIKITKNNENNENNTILISIYKNINSSSIIDTFPFKKGEFLTVCCFRFLIKEITPENVTINLYDMYDSFCGIQNTFSIKGVYRR